MKLYTSFHYLVKSLRQLVSNPKLLAIKNIEMLWIALLTK